MLPTTQLATTIDTFIKDTVLSSNEGRILIGRTPVDRPDANTLENPFTSSGKNKPISSVSEKPEDEEN